MSKLIIYYIINYNLKEQIKMKYNSAFNFKLIYKLSCLIVIFILCSYKSSFSKDTLSVKHAIEIALENNYSISIAKNQTLIAEKNYNLGNAGFLPKLDLTGQQNWGLNNSQQQYANDSLNIKNGASSNSFSAGISLNWTIFDGMNMFINYNRLNELKDTSYLQLKLKIENMISKILDTYYSIIKESIMYFVYNESVSLSEERLRIIKDKFNVGTASKIEMLQSQVDLNADKSKLLTQQTVIKNLKTTLNQILARDLKIDYDVAQYLDFRNDFILSQIIDLMNKNNTSLMIADKNKNIASLNLDISESKLFPKLGLYANYNYLNSQTPTDYTRLNINSGISYGISLSYNIFNGLISKTEIENAKIIFENNNISYNDVKSQLEKDLTNNFNDHQKNLELVKFEEENIIISKENLDLAFERLRVGTISNLELREAQLSYESSQSRYTSAIYNAKVSEKELLRISGQLVGSK